ncbi:hypothetical protein GQ607_010589 [Colletotrichum asianum]|uniref:NACHT-NTPase and P-loop NTPases N-terminal domain-containing protein n=1 Tax=Colletotrichum asianum TaxID=702518 RepID=A0A8H3WAD7_9PEZI|nr:hypothetical protein GQ607_010589 [Colletotrichum asianum]
MAEAIGLASSVIAITDVAFKAGSAYLKIIRLLDEMKQVPTELRLKADRVRFIEEFLFYAEDNLSKNPLPSSAWSPTLLQDQLSKCHTILSDTYQLAQDQYVLAMITYSLASKAQDPAKNVELHDTVNTNQTLSHISPPEPYGSHKSAPTGGKLGKPKLEEKKGLDSTNPSRKAHSVSYEPSIFGRFHFSLQANRGIHVVIQAPSWITSTVYSVLAQRAIVGWQMNLRADEMVMRFDWELLKLIEDDKPQAVFKYLDEHKMSPFVRNWKGKTLLYETVRYGAVSATRALLDSGLNAVEVPPRKEEVIPRILYHLGSLSSCDVIDKGPLLIQLLGDNGLDDYLDDSDFLLQAAVCGLPFVNFRALIERCSFTYWSLPIWKRLIHIRTVVSCIATDWVQAWNVEEILFLLNEGKSPGLELLQESRSEDEIFVCHGIHTRANVRTPVVVIVRSLQSAFRLWIETLVSSGEDLLLYGKHERDLHIQGHTHIYQKFTWQAWNEKRGNMRYSILGITYGSLPQQWSLWITNENYDYAGEFWAMVENQNIKVPGSWVDDASDLTEWMRIREELGAWQQEAAPPFIWSEYRKPRPPI